MQVGVGVWTGRYSQNGVSVFVMGDYYYYRVAE